MRSSQSRNPSLPEEKRESAQAETFVSSSGMTYELQDLITRFNQSGCFDDYKVREAQDRLFSSRWLEPFSLDDIERLLAYPVIFHAVETLFGNAHSILRGARKVDAPCLRLIAELVDAARPLSVGWSSVRDEELSVALSAPISNLYAYLKGKERESVNQGLDLIGDFTGYRYARTTTLLNDLHRIIENHCSAGFIDAMAAIYGVLLTANVYRQVAARQDASNPSAYREPASPRPSVLMFPHAPVAKESHAEELNVEASSFSKSF